MFVADGGDACLFRYWVRACNFTGFVFVGMKSLGCAVVLGLDIRACVAIYVMHDISCERVGRLS